MATQTQAVALPASRQTLTPRQRDCFQAIKKLLRIRNGVGPSLEELAEAINVKDASSALRLVQALERKGYIYREPGAWRSWKVLA